MANNPFAVEQKVYNLMPNDEYIDACILSYQTAELPPGPMAMTNDTVPSTRFLLGAYLKDESGQLKCDANGVPIIARKWTKWMRISNNERSALMRLFDTSKTGFQNLFDILQVVDYASQDYARAEWRLSEHHSYQAGCQHGIGKADVL